MGKKHPPEKKGHTKILQSTAAIAWKSEVAADRSAYQDDNIHTF